MRVAAILGMAGVCVALPVAADPGTSGPSWTGASIGISGGVTGADITYTEDAIQGISNEIVYQFSDRKAVYSIHLGYDKEVGNNVVIGGEIAGSWNDFNIDPLSSGGFGSLFGADYDVTATARVGALTDPNTLVYGKLGVGAISAYAEEGLQDTARALLPAAVFGAGIETLIANGLSARVEGTYLMPIQQLDIPADAKRFDPRYMRITTGLSWRLDSGSPTDRTIAATASDAPEAFSGVYVGAVAGYNIGRMDVPVSTPGATVGPFAAEGPSFGLHAGYDVRLSDFVVGVGAEFTRTAGAFHDPGQNSPLQGSTTLFGNLDAIAMATVRAGFMASPSTLIYGKGGLGYVQMTANPEFFTFDSGGQRWLGGYQLGGGAETMLSENVSLRVEGAVTRAIEGFTVDLTQSEQATVYPSNVAVYTGLNWRF